MPLAPLVLLLSAVLIATGLTIWLLTSAGPMALMIALPIFLTATATLMYLRR